MSSTEGSLQASTLIELQQLFEHRGFSAHQARLTFQAIHRHGKLIPSEMPGISAACRKFLESLPPLPALSVDAVLRAEDGTVKLRIKTPAGDAIEAVIIPAGSRVTLCVSSQVGCAAGCAFCHTGTMGLLRNLSAWEIVEQYRLAKDVWQGCHGATAGSIGCCSLPRARARSKPNIQLAPWRPPAITNVVFMGMGEPLHNEENVARACRIFNEDLGAGFSRRHIAVSTAGVGNRIRPFWEEGVASLSVSLHATTDEVRNRIVPLNRQWNAAALREILLGIPWRRREWVVIAYLLLDGVNDSYDDALRLTEWVRGMPAKINLLEFNPYPGSTFQRASPEKLAQFRGWLDERGVFNTLRLSRGQDAMAACGQLALKVKSKK